MSDEGHRHTVIPPTAAGRAHGQPGRLAPVLRPRPLAEKLAAEPLVTAAVCMLIGALVANLWANRFGQTRARLKSEGLQRLNRAQRLDPLF